MFDIHPNLALVAVTVAPSPAASGTTLGVSNSDAALLPDPSDSGNTAYNATVMPANTPPTLNNAEIIRISDKGAADSAGAGNTQLTIARTQESTSARTIQVGDRLIVAVTKKTLTDIEQAALLYGVGRQAIINGNFDIWQRATSRVLTATTVEFTADRFYTYADANGGTLPTLTFSRQVLTSGDILNAFYFARLNTNGAGSSLGSNASAQLVHKIEHATRLFCGLNKKITITFYAKSNISSKKIGIWLIQNYGTGGTPTSEESINGTNVTLSTNWTKYKVTLTTNTLVGKTFGTNRDDYLALVFYYMWGSNKASLVGAGSAETFIGSGDIDIAQIQVCVGETALEFQPKSFEEELRMCQRYFHKSYDYNQSLGALDTNGAISGVGINVLGRPILQFTYPQRMRKIPTVVFYSPGTGTSGKLRDATAAGDMPATGLYLGENGGLVHDPLATVASGNHVVAHYTADAEL